MDNDDVIKNNDMQIIGGTIEISNARITPVTNPIYGNCHFCMIYVNDGYDMLGKITCKACRGKIMERLKLILDFE